jgi:hypothetical protein
MSVLDQIAHFQNRRDEVPNQELAHKLAETGNTAGIREIAENLWNKDKRIQADCIKVLYEVGYLAPELVVPYAGDFLKLLRSRNNRLVWGGMIALSTVANLAAETLFTEQDEIYKAMQRGSVITVDAGVLALAKLASTSQDRRRELLPRLFDHLKNCRPKDVAQHSEKVAPAVNGEHAEEFIAVLESRMEDLSETQARRIKKVITQVNRGISPGKKG